MITPAELKEKAGRMFFTVASAALRNETLFPLAIPANRQLSGQNFNSWQRELIPLHEQSKAARGKGYTVEWKQKAVNGTKQSVPARFFFETMADYLWFTRRETDFTAIMEAHSVLTEAFASLKEWSCKHPAILLEHASEWTDIVEVCNYFTSHPPPHPYYIRDLPVTVHSKFIEERARLFRHLLDMLLPAEQVNANSADFSERYGLKKAGVYTQIRILDEALKPHLGYDECALALEDAAWLQWLPQRVFIVENQACFLTFPKLLGSVAIFGEGFKSRLTRHIPWLDRTRLYCWFDLDAAGFEMLNMIREHYPAAESFLMGAAELDAFSDFIVPNQPRPKRLSRLTQAEQACYETIVTNRQRLEQEKITQAHVLSSLQKMFY